MEVETLNPTVGAWSPLPHTRRPSRQTREERFTKTRVQVLTSLGELVPCQPRTPVIVSVLTRPFETGLDFPPMYLSQNLETTKEKMFPVHVST